MTTTPLPRHITRDARLAAVKAARANAPQWVSVETTVGEIRVGDYLEIIPTQGGFRGTIFKGHVTEAIESYEHYTFGLPRRRLPVAAIVIRTALVQGTVAYPSTFKAIVRRKVSA